MFHVKHSGHFLLLFEPIIFLTTDTDNFRGKLFHVKHREKSAANGVRLNFLCRRFTFTMPRPLLVSTFVVPILPAFRQQKSARQRHAMIGQTAVSSIAPLADPQRAKQKHIKTRSHAAGVKVPTDRHARLHRSGDAESRVQSATHLMRHT